MKRVLSILSFLFLLLLTIPVVQAQEALTQTYTTSDGSFSIMYPTGWKVDDSYSAAGFTQFSSGPTIAMNQAMEPLKSGDIGVALFLTPNSFLDGMSITGNNIVDTVGKLNTVLGHANGKVEDLTIGTYPAARVVGNSFDNDGEVIGMDLGNGKQAIAVGISFKGEQANLDTIMLAMLATAAPGSSSASTGVTEAATAIPAATEAAAASTDAAAPSVALGETFTAPDGSFTMMYPAGWVVDTQSDFPHFTTANVPKTSAEAFESGDIYKTLDLASIITPMGVSGDNIHDYVSSFLKRFKFPTSTIEDLTLGGHPAARAVDSTGDIDREIIGVDFGNAQKIIFSGSTFKGELANLDVNMQAMLNSIQFGAAAPSPTPAATTVPTTTLSLQPKLLWTDTTYGFPVSSLAFSPDDTSLFISAPLNNSGANTDLTLADAATGNALFSPLTGLQRAAGQVAFSPDGSTVAGFDTEALIVWDVATSAVKTTIQTKQYESPTDIAFNPKTGALLYITQADPEDTLWQLDPASGQPEGIYTIADRNNVLQGMAISPDGSSVLVGIRDYSQIEVHTTVYQIDLESHDATKVFDQPGVAQVALLYPAQGQPLIAVNPNDTYMTQVWDITSNTLLYTLPEAKTKEGTTVATTVVAINPAGTILATSSISVEAQLWDAKTGAPLVTLDRNKEQMQNSAAYGFAFTHQGNRLAVFYGDRTVVLWSLDGSGAPATTDNTSSPTEVPTTVSNTTTASTCSITAAKGANLRTGPGTTFDRAGALAAGTSQSVIGQANSSDGFVWWKLESGSWVRSDLVQTTGDCTGAPTVAS